MTKIPLQNVTGKKAGEVEVRDEIFDVPVNEHLVHSAVVTYLRNQRKGQSRSKTRAQVSGGGVKPWRQKGTGRARAGSNTSPIWARGGAAHGPVERDYSVTLPKKMLRNALCSALTAKRKSAEISVVEGIKLNAPKTKDAQSILTKLKLDGKTVLVLSNVDKNIRLSFRNIRGVRIQNPASLNTYDVLDCNRLVFDKESLDVLTKRLAAK